MKIGRVLVDSPDGEAARLVSVYPDENVVIDLATAERLRLVRAGASPAAARRVALAHFPGSLTAALELGVATFLHAARRAVKPAPPEAAITLDRVRWLPPADPTVVRDFNAFRNHKPDAAEAWETAPLYFKINPTTVVGPGALIDWPADCAEMDYELELGLVVGAPGRDLTPRTAMACLFGVTLLNDLSGRDLLRRELPGGLGPAKGKDFATAIGPWITTVDELDPADLEMTAAVNGVEWSRGSMSDIKWTISEILAYASAGERIVPGELIGAGTLPDGCGRELGRTLSPGDRVELSARGLGVLANVLGTPRAATWRPERRVTASE